MQPIFKTVAVLDLLLNRENPRHTKKESQEEVIAYLLADEEVYNLARHMCQHGINPLEVVAVFPDEDGNFVVAEGNRRVCAAQLLTDPEKAPASARSRFKALAARSGNVSQINIAIFSDYATAQPWLQVLHDGEQDGIGRRRWKPEQKARATTNKNTNALAVSLLDYAQDQGLVNGERRQNILVSTATRYLANPKVREAMGLASAATSDKIEITTDTERFHKVLADFMDGLENKILHSRSTSKDWLEYASKLDQMFGAPNISSAQLKISGNTIKSKGRKLRPTRARIVPPETQFIAKSAQLISGLNKLGSFKLSSLYHSLTSLRLDEHPAFVTVGAWAFVEVLTALHGRTNTDFSSYLNGKFHNWGISKERAKDCRLSLDYISSHGNAQKHSATFSAIDARNLNNHFKVLEDVFIALVNDCLAAEQEQS